VNLIWATRGRSWGFRFLLDGGLPDPLLTYERGFSGVEGEREVSRRVDVLVAVRFGDPEGRCDDAGRPISHDVVILPPAADDVRVDDAGTQVWPELADAYARVWEQPRPPSAVDLGRAFSGNRRAR